MVLGTSMSYSMDGVLSLQEPEFYTVGFFMKFTQIKQQTRFNICQLTFRSILSPTEAFFFFFEHRDQAIYQIAGVLSSRLKCILVTILSAL